ncbi:selenide, water dikinase SelD [Palleronia rufa]|uniref:selenide, water dikinase SelD n=1 Tax=Palleronia rufa TaxID=1530186 RepID=UPI00068EBB2A|nr:selenide, water dikinase SelD [Palleronia rufa]
MLTPSLPLTRDIVLIGGGHAHALVLRRWGMDPLPGARLTVINPGPTAPYTGMLPGFVAGHYDRDTLEIDLVRLARFAGARLILGRATGLDPAAREIAIDDRLIGARRIGYDVASLDIGIHSQMPDLPGFSEHGVAAKPLGRFAARWAAVRDGGDPIAVIGGGVAGVELAMAMRHGTCGRPVTVIERDRALSGLGRRAADRLRRAMAETGVTLIEGEEVARLTARAVVLADGREIPAGFVTGAAGARPHGWLAETGLPLHRGYVAVDETLRTGDPAVFAVGDCAHLTHAPRPKAGVFAVRQAPVLHDNLRAAVSGGRLRPYRPQKDYLKLISTGGRSAVADKFGLAWSGPWLWRWKDRIDRRFMARLSDLPAPPAPRLPVPRADGLDAAALQAPCAGCGAKVGRGALGAALSGLAPAVRRDVERGAGDDAAILRIGGVGQVLTVDTLRAFTHDPGLLAHVAILHALGDCLAMGARPQAVLSSLTLPRLSPRLEARTLAEILRAAEAALADTGAAIVGGHSATGPEMQLGFAVTGLLDGAPIQLSGARPGDALILTKPLGTGVVLAAEMALTATGPEVAAALAAMAAPQRAAARVLGDARAMTDVTGFGLAGHLMGICESSGVAAEIALDRLPLLPGAARLLRAGVRSTLHAANRDAVRVEGAQGPLAEILYDPQTAGGLLAAVAPDAAAAMLADLPGAARIGRIADGPPALRLTGGAPREGPPERGPE